MKSSFKIGDALTKINPWLKGNSLETTLLALIPAALGLGDGPQFLQPLGIK